MDGPITSREELLKLVQSQANPITRTHEQNVMVVLAIARAKVHPGARMHKAVDGTVTITIPPGGTT